MITKVSISKNKYLLNIVAVLFNNLEEVTSYISMLSKQSIFDNLLISIVMNSQNYDHYNLMRIFINNKKFNNVQIFSPNTNLGYLNSLIYSYNNLRPLQKTPWYILSNTDILIDDYHFFEKFIAKTYNSNIWSIGPSIYSPNNKSYDNPQYSNRHSIKKLNMLIFIHKHLIFSTFYHLLSRVKAKLTRKKLSKSKYVYSNHGSFLILKEDLLSIIKNEFYKPIMYSEELFISEVILKNNKLAFYEDNLFILHRENSTTSLLKTRVKIKFIHDSLIFNKEKFYLSK